MTVETSSTPSWSDILPELAGLVLLRLPVHADRVRFAAVCPRWRLVAREVPLPPPLPLLAFPDGTVYSVPGTEPLHLPSGQGYADACGGNWLFFSVKILWDRIFFLEDGDDDDDLRNGKRDHSDEERLGPCRVFHMKNGKVSDSLPTVSWKRNWVQPAWLFPQGQK